MRDAFNAYHYIALGCAAVVLFIVMQYFSALITFVRSIFTRRASRKRAVERLRSLPRGKPLEPQPAAGTELSLPVAAEVEPVLGRAEPLEVQPVVSTEVPRPADAQVRPFLEGVEPQVPSGVSDETPAPDGAQFQPTVACVEPPYSGNSQPLRENTVRQNILDALMVDRQTDEVKHGLSEVQPAAGAKVLLPVSIKVEPILEPAEPLEAQPAARAEVPPPVGATLRPILERAGPRELQPVASSELPLQVGSEVWAVCKFGSVAEGTPGIITGVAAGRYFWQSPAYLCTFADNRKVRARPTDIEVYNHGHSLQELEHPNLGAILSRRMAVRAQQLLSRQRPTNPRFGGRA